MSEPPSSKTFVDDNVHPILDKPGIADFIHKKVLEVECEDT
jgi:hypothetical protein